MRRTARVNPVPVIEDLANAQHGYFTRAQAVDSGIHDVQLLRAVDHGLIYRLDHGVYRVAGAGIDDHADLRIAWLRLDPRRRPRERTRDPDLWVSHRSAAVLHGLGVFIPTIHDFISTTRKQLRTDNVRVRVRPNGIDRQEWVIRDGMAVTSPLRTLIDLDADRTDGGHLGAFLRDALHAGAIDRHQLDHIDLRNPIDALLDMAGEAGPI